jgi:ubiquinone/menaquinone biosynthesis C-methylase UbiE
VQIGPRYQGLAERVGGLLNLVPVPPGLSMFGMPIARGLQVAQRLGILNALAEGPATAAELSERLGLRTEGTKLVLDTLCAAGVLRLRGGERYDFTRRARKWLDPESDRYVGGFLEDTSYYWAWWQGLEDLVRDGRAVNMHDRPDDDPYWRTYIQGQYELARLSSDAVARAVRLDQGARSLLDVAGGHGEFSMALCRRHDGLEATIVDLPGSAAVGRGIVERAGMGDRVGYVTGDMFEADYGGPHDGALTFNIVHHLSPSQARALFARIASALRPGAPLCVLDLYARDRGEQPDTGAFLGLFFHLTSGADTYSSADVSGWLRESGFDEPTVKTLPQIPGLALVRAERSAA